MNLVGKEYSINKNEKEKKIKNNENFNGVRLSNPSAYLTTPLKHTICFECVSSLPLNLKRDRKLLMDSPVFHTLVLLN